jgi:hypothetical protein
MPKGRGFQNLVGLAITDDGEELVRSFFKLFGINYEWREAPWVEVKSNEFVKRLGTALELFKIAGGGLAIGAKPLVFTIITLDYGVMLIKDGEWYYLASSDLNPGSTKVSFIKTRGNYLELTAIAKH